MHDTPSTLTADQLVARVAQAQSDMRRLTALQDSMTPDCAEWPGVQVAVAALSDELAEIERVREVYRNERVARRDRARDRSTVRFCGSVLLLGCVIAIAAGVVRHTSAPIVGGVVVGGLILALMLAAGAAGAAARARRRP
jgi:hypothetical protein